MKVLKYTVLTFILAGLIGGIAYGAGLRFHDGRVVRAGSVTVLLPPQAGALFFDGEQKRLETGADSITFSKVSPGEHVLIYGADNVLPWQRNFTLLPGEDRTFKPFVSPQDLSGFFIGAEDKEYKDIQSSFNQDSLPAESGAIISDDGTTALWVMDTALFLDWRGRDTDIPAFFCTGVGDVCNTRLLFFEGDNEIRNASFYKDRSDVIIIGTDDTVFAVDASINDFRNFQPLYTGEGVDFRKKDNDELYVRDVQNGEVRHLIVRY